jgi:small GTP-binding protein
MTTTPRLQRISEADLDGLIAELRRQGTTELILLGSDIEMPASVDQWPKALRDKSWVYQLIEPVEALAERLAELTQLTTLNLEGIQIGAEGVAALAALPLLTSLGLWGNQIGAEGAAALTALTQLTSLDVGNNQIGDKEASAVAALSQLTTLDLGDNQIGAEGAAALAALTQLTSLDLWGNGIDAAGASALAALTQLTSLDLSENQIGDAGASSLAALTQLTSLDLSENQIGDAGASSLAALTQLTSLDLSENQIGDAGASALAALTQLTSLDLSENQIGDAGATALAALTHLTRLDLRNNQIGVEGAAAMAAFTQLTSLVLWNNKIGDEGAAALAALTQLTSLNLGYNEIGDEGATALAALTQLTSLDLGGNGIGAAGASALSALTQLTSLSLSSNEIGDAGASALSALAQLTTLDLGDNQIGAEGAASLAALTQLNTLNLSDNQIGDEGATALAALTQLNTLHLSQNQIGAAGASSLAALTQLTSLDLGGNEIGAAGASSLAALLQLTSLDLWGNGIDAAGAAVLAALKNLASLDLSSNPVVETASFATLRLLTYLNLRETKVQDLSPLQTLLKRGLEAKWEEIWSDNGINVYNCPLIHPPPEIVKQGQAAVLNYLREIEAQGEDHLYEAKVLILGDGGAGKTTLLRRLYQTDQPIPAEEESTKGIDIYRHTFTNAADRSFHLNVWDFGGQQIYHATHQFFLTKRSLYILVDDTRNSSQAVQDDGFKYWLELIEALSEGSPVLIFQNEKAGRSKRIDAAGIKGRFANVKDVYRGNLEHADAADKLAEAIRFHVQQLPHVGEAVPARWLEIRAELEERKQLDPYISRKEYFHIYGRYLEFGETKALQLSRYLHDLGVFLHFQDDPLLARLVILKNDWATEAVFNVLDDEPTKARSGYFTRADCQRIWAHSTYGDLHPELLALMEKFELCYKLADQPSETWLATQLLSPSTPKAVQDWPQPDDLVLTYQYDFLPKGLISRLICRMNRFVRQPDRSWRSGAFFEHVQSELLVRLASPLGQEIELRARGPERKALLSVISSDLDALNATFEGLRDKVRKLVPCFCSNCRLSTSPERYEEGRLQKRKQDGKLTVECPESYEDVSVLELLDGLKLEPLPPWATSAPRTIMIFLASSSELREDRDAFELHFLRKNKDFRCQGFEVEVIRWETSLDAMSETRLQEDYNEKVRKSDIFVSLFKTKTGIYTEEEFDVAHTTFKNFGKPLIYTYFMQSHGPYDIRMREDLNSLWDFQKKLKDLGHYPTHYTSIEDLKLQFQQQLDTLIDEGKI